MKKLTPESACVEYAIAADAVREISAKIRVETCERAIANPLDLSCLRVFFEEQEGDLCPGCEQKLQLVKDRKEARKRLGHAKRAVLMVGRRIKHVTVP